MPYANRAGPTFLWMTPKIYANTELPMPDPAALFIYPVFTQGLTPCLYKFDSKSYRCNPDLSAELEISLHSLRSALCPLRLGTANFFMDDTFLFHSNHTQNLTE